MGQAERVHSDLANYKLNFFHTNFKLEAIRKFFNLQDLLGLHRFISTERTSVFLVRFSVFNKNMEL